MKKLIQSTSAPAAIGPYSQAIELEGQGLIYFSGQIPLDPSTMELAGADVETQTHQVMKNIGAVLQAAGLDYGHIIKTTIFLTAMSDFPAVNDIYASYLNEPFPARSTIQVAGLPKGAQVEIEVIAKR